MSTSHLPDPDSETLQEQLVAYLDGELDAQSSRQVEETLARDAEVQSELVHLEKVWDLLDGLPRADVGENFTRTTVEMVAACAEEELQQERASEPARRRWRWLSGAMSMLAAAVLGFALTEWLWPDPNAQLEADYQVLTNLEFYRQAEDIDFLRQLYANGLFLDDDQTGVVDGNADQTPRQRIEALTPPEKEHLVRSLQRFKALPPADQQQLRVLDAKLTREPQAAELQRVMRGYYQWLTTLSADKRAELSQTPISARAEAVKKLHGKLEVDAVENSSGQRLSPDDIKEIITWFADVRRSNERALIESMSPEERKNYEDSEGWRKRIALSRALTEKQKNWKLVGDDDLAKLIPQLSPEAQHALASAQSNSAKIRMVFSWVEPAARAQWRRYATRGSSEDRRAELEKFFESLPQSERERLLALPNDKRRREFRKHFEEFKKKQRAQQQQSAPSEQANARPNHKEGRQDHGKDRPAGEGSESSGQSPSSNRSVSADGANSTNRTDVGRDARAQ